LSEAERKVGARLRPLIKTFLLNSDVEELGDTAKRSIGWIAQEVIEAFAAEGLDALAYKVVEYDQWKANDAVMADDGETVITPAREAGDLYGVRETQLLAFI